MSGTGTPSAADRLRPFRGTARVGRKGSRAVVCGERDWVFRGTASEVVQLREALPGMCLPLGDDFLLLQFGNRVGILDLPVLGEIELVAGKWDERHFESMLRDLTRICVNLPFAAQDTAALPYDRSALHNEDVLYHAFVYLRYVLSDAPPHEERLHTALNVVLANPHRRWRGVTRTVPLDQVRQIAPETLLALATAGSRGGDTVPLPSHAPEVLRRVGPHVPAMLPERRPEPTVDTAENRFVKAFLHQVRGVLGAVRELGEATQSPFGRRMALEAARLDRQLGPIRNRALWRDVGPMTHVPSGSSVLQRQRGYRHILQHYSKLRLAARIPLDPEQTRDLLEAKDIALLYELWAYFQVAEALTELLGRPDSALRLKPRDLQVDLPFDFEIRWDEVTLSFNPRFSRTRGESRRSYSTPLRPDIALEVKRSGGAELHLLDAKFRVDRLWSGPEQDEESDLLEIDDEERRGTFKRADLYKMHTYRDAIPAARSAWILYPGTEFRFYHSGEGRVSDGAVGLGFPHGVGAVPLLPGSGRVLMSEALYGVLNPRT